jgi:hypothetical protein
MRRALALVLASSLASAGCAPALSEASAPPRQAPAHLLRTEVAAAAEPVVSPASPETKAPPPAAQTDSPRPVDQVMSPETKAAPSEAHGGDAIPRAVGWFSLSFGITAGIVALGTSIMMLQQAKIRNDDCVNKVCSADGLNANGQLDGLAGWNVASYIAAGVGIGVGAILLITTSKRDHDRETAIGVTPNGGGAGLTLRSTF